MPFPLPHTVHDGETARLAQLRAYAILDTVPEDDFDSLTQLAAGICGTPAALVSFVDADRQWFKSRVGLARTQTSRAGSFCAHAIAQKEAPFIVADARVDSRFAENELVKGEPSFRFYAGAPLVVHNGLALGTLCVLDRVPRALDEHQAQSLRALAHAVVNLLEKRHTDIRVRLLEQVAQSANDGVLIYRASTDEAQPARIVYVNGSFTRMTGYAPDEVLGANGDMLYGENTDAEAVRASRRELLNGRGIVNELIVKRKDGCDITVETSISPVYSERATHWVALVRDISDRRRAEAERLRAERMSAANAALEKEIVHRRRVEEQLSFTASHDDLTGLPNRRCFTERLQTTVKGVTEGALPPDSNAVLFVDLDRFKRINDTVGHLRGDELLQQVARRIAGCLRPLDTLARFGGDEFAVLLAQLPGQALPGDVAARIVKALAAPFRIGTADLFVTASIGVASIGAEYVSADDVLRDADIAMFRAKESGRDRCHVFATELRERILAGVELETDLRRAIEREELCLAYQPIVTLRNDAARHRRDGRIAEFEVLVRWRHAKRGLLSAGAFISAAEESGLIVPVDEWVLLEGCRQLCDWQRRFGKPGFVPRLSINVSAHNFTSSRVVANVERVLRETGVRADQIALELTESAIMEDVDHGMVMLQRLRALGVHLHLDDFGTGYSSLNYLRRFPVDRVKIDRSFVSGAGEGLADFAIIETVVSLAHRLGIEAVAEGVETEQQLTALAWLGCDAAQGYLFSAPVDATAAAMMLAGPVARERVAQKRAFIA